MPFIGYKVLKYITSVQLFYIFFAQITARAQGYQSSQITRQWNTVICRSRRCYLLMDLIEDFGGGFINDTNDLKIGGYLIFPLASVLCVLFDKSTHSVFSTSISISSVSLDNKSTANNCRNALPQQNCRSRGR